MTPRTVTGSGNVDVQTGWDREIPFTAFSPGRAGGESAVRIRCECATLEERPPVGPTACALGDTC